MWYVRRAAAFLCLALLAPGLALAQAPEGLKDTRSFFQDVGGYHAQGTAEAPERGEAQRLAKAAALRHLFTEIGKDMIFAEMCISGWPEYISVEDSVSVERDELHVVQVQVVVATSAIMLTEQKYQIAVTELLNAMERSMAEVEKDLAEADGLERNLKVAEALGAYRRARTGAGGVRELVRDVGDKSVLSESGNNIAALSTRLDALSLRISGGLDRMEAIEREAQQSAAADEMTKAYELYDQELLAMESRGEEYLALSPFYDLPRTRLDGILIDLQADRAKGAQVSAELERLRGTIPQDREYLGQKIDLSLADAAALAKRLEKMEEEVRLEIKTPRLVRQERAQRRKAALAAVGRGASYAFLHKPRDIATFEWKLPLVWDMEKAVRATGGADVRLEVEGAFPGGLWIRGSLGHDDVTDIAGAQTWRSSAWSSSFDLGVGKKTILGVGVIWDWERSVAEPEDAPDLDAERELGLRLNLGGMDVERRRVNWMLSLGYVLPTVQAGGILLPYHLNASLSARIKAGDILILRGAVRTKAYQSAQLSEDDEFTAAFSYRFDWNVGIGVRLPPPFILSISYGGQLTAGLTPQGLTDADPHAGGWSLTLGYVF